MDISKLYADLVDAANDVETAKKVLAVLIANGLLPGGTQTDGSKES